MAKINWGRVFLGGLLAGLVINIFEYVTNGVVLAADWDAAMRALGRHLPMSAIAVFVVGGFISGIAAIWLYAAARPRFGAGPKTAVLTGFAYTEARTQPPSISARCHWDCFRSICWLLDASWVCSRSSRPA